MQHDPRSWLWDGRQPADSIAAFVRGHEFADYEANLMLRSAVERQFEIAGEALTRHPERHRKSPRGCPRFGVRLPCAMR
jgi:uncharacterized protein with HEPN domain